MRVNRGMAAALLVALGTLLASCNTKTPASFDPEELALVRVEPSDGESSVARNRVVRLTFNTTVLPDSVHEQSLRVRVGGQFQVLPEGTFLISGNVIEFDPTLTAEGSPNAAGFPAGEAVLVELPLFTPDAGQPANEFVQNVEGNPVTAASDDNLVSFTTGCEWADTVPGAPGVLSLSFTPGPNSVGQVPSNAAVTVVFSEPVDPESVILGQNIFLTNATDTSEDFQQDIPSLTFVDGSLTRYTFLPVFGFGQGPFSIAVNFIDPDAPDTFSPDALPRDLGGNRIQNFTFLQTFDTEFDPDVPDADTIREDFTTAGQRDTPNTTAAWGNDPDIPFALASLPPTTRIQNIDVSAILAAGGVTDLPDTSFGHTPPPDPTNEGRFCASAAVLVGPDLVPAPNFPPSSAGGRNQQIIRAAEMGGRGTIIRAAWGPAGDTTTASTYDRVIIRVGHKRPGTNLTIESFSSEFDVDGFVTVVDSSYSLGQANDVNGGNRNDGYVDWPEFQQNFAYNGTDDLLFDVQAVEGTATQNFRNFIAATATPTCSCGLVFAGSSACTLNDSIGLREKLGVFGSDQRNPTVVASGLPNPSPTVNIMQFELAQLISVGTSLYYDSGTPEPDYQDPIVGPLVQPCGASIQIEWGASSDGIVDDVPFTNSIHACDGFRFIRFRITLVANQNTQSQARVSVLEIPFLRG